MRNLGKLFNTSILFLFYGFYIFQIFQTFQAMASTNLYADNQESLGYLRKTYLEAIEDATINDNLLADLEKIKSKTPTFLAYQGACEGLRAKHSLNPYKKVEYLKKAQKTLLDAIKQSPNNIEIRYLRFSIQHNCPAFLRNNQDMEEDRLVIINNINTETNQQLDKSIIQLIVNFLIHSNRCDDKEIEILKASVVKP